MTVVLIVYVDVSALILSVYLVFQFFLYYKKNYDKQIQLVKLFGRHGIGLKVVCSLSTGHKIDILLAAWSLEWWFIQNLVYCLQRSCQPLSSLASILESFLKTLVYLHGQPATISRDLLRALQLLHVMVGTHQYYTRSLASMVLSWCVLYLCICTIQ